MFILKEKKKCKVMKKTPINLYKSDLLVFAGELFFFFFENISEKKIIFRFHSKYSKPHLLECKAFDNHF